MPKEKILDFIKRALFAENIDCSLEPSHARSGSRLLVNFIKDHKNRSRVLEITEQELSLQPRPKKDHPEIHSRIQFLIMLPFQAKDSALHDIASLILFLNRTLELPGLELNELDNRIYYRYVLMTKTDGLTEELVLAIVGVILLMLDLFSNTIEKVADGTHTFNELLQEVIDATDQMLKQ